MFQSLLKVILPLTIKGFFQYGQCKVELWWANEFNSPNGSELDSTYWNYEIGDGSDRQNSGWGNSELQYYTRSVENVATDGEGHLAITARANLNSSTYSCYYGPCLYTSGRIISKFSRTYGRFEARIKTPEGQGIWPAFWMLGENVGDVGWPECGAINIMELRGSQPMTVGSALHGPGYSGGQAISKSKTLKSGPSFAEDFHVFTLDWRPTSITWSVDGQPYHTSTPASVGSNRWVFDHPFNILLNVAVGGNFDGNPGTNVTFPQSLLIDYIRIYDYKDNETISTAIPFTKGPVVTTTLPESAASAMVFLPCKIHVLLLVASVVMILG